MNANSDVLTNIIMQVLAFVTGLPAVETILLVAVIAK